MIAARTARRVSVAACLWLAGSLASAPAFAQDQPAAAPRHLTLRAHRAGPHPYRPLLVRRPLAPAPVAVEPAPAPVFAPLAGVGTIVTAPIGVASALVALPFRVVNGIFPADAPPPVNFIGAPVAAAGQIAQAPFRLLGAPFDPPAL